MTPLQTTLLSVLVPLCVVLVYVGWRYLAARYINKLYNQRDREAQRSKAGLDEGGRPPRSDPHSTALDAVSRLGWKDFFRGNYQNVAAAVEYSGRVYNARNTETESAGAILRHGLSNPSTRSLYTGYVGGEEYEMHSPVDVPPPPQIQRPHLASSLGTQAPSAALFAKKSQDSLRTQRNAASRAQAGSDPFVDPASSSFDPRPPRIHALSGGESSQMALSRPPKAVLRGSPLKKTVRPESVGEPIPPVPEKFSSLAAAPAPSPPNAGWRLFPSPSPYDRKPVIAVDPEDGPVTSTTIKGKGKAVE